MRTAKLMIVLLILMGGVALAAEETPTTKYTYDKYRAIYERNVFSKDRRPPQTRIVRRPTRRTTTVLSIYVLRGIAAEEGRTHKFAFIEEQISGESRMEAIGARILDGQIKDIQMNYVLFEEGGQTRKIRVGEEFGQTSSTVTEEASGFDDGGEPAAGDNNAAPTEEKTGGTSPAVDESDMLKKLLERRQRELGT